MLFKSNLWISFALFEFVMILFFFFTSSLVYCVTVTLKIYKLIFLSCMSVLILFLSELYIQAQPSYKKKMIIAISILHLNQCNFCSCSYLAISSQKTRSQIKYLVKTSACSLCPRNTALERLQVGSCWYHFVIRRLSAFEYNGENIITFASWNGTALHKFKALSFFYI